LETGSRRKCHSLVSLEEGRASVEEKADAMLGSWDVWLPWLWGPLVFLGWQNWGNLDTSFWNLKVYPSHFHLLPRISSLFLIESCLLTCLSPNSYYTFSNILRSNNLANWFIFLFFPLLKRKHAKIFVVNESTNIVDLSIIDRLVIIS
jgi:hypothetical protein